MSQECEMAEEALIAKQARIDELERELAGLREAYERLYKAFCKMQERTAA